jgi:hypothetical protein
MQLTSQRIRACLRRTHQPVGVQALSEQADPSQPAAANASANVTTRARSWSR